MNKKGFTLIELLGVIMILAIIMMIAIPNVMSILEKGKKDNYLADAKKLITQAEYAIRNGNVGKPSTSDIYKITLRYLGTNDVEKDSDGNKYSLDNSFVAVIRTDDGYLEYYINLAAEILDKEGNISQYDGIYLVNEDELDGENKNVLIDKNISIPSNSQISSITGRNGATVKVY